MKLFSFSFLLFFLSLSSLSMYSVEMKDYLTKNALIFDVGANVGAKTHHYLSLGASQVICVEPQPFCIKVLSETFFNSSQVTIVPMGLSDHEGAIPFYICSYGSVISTASQDWQKGRFKNEVWDTEIMVPVTTLDKLIEMFGMPDFCKIDVEGYELNVLKGLSQPIPLLSFEFTCEYLEKCTRPCLQHLSQLGYRRFNVSIGHNENFHSDKWMSTEELMEILRNHPDPVLWGDIYAQY